MRGNHAQVPTKPSADSRTNAIGAALRRARERHGMSLQDLDDATGIDASLLSRIENGTIRDMKLTTVVKLARALDFELDAFATDAGLFGKVAKANTIQRGVLAGDIDDVLADAQSLVDALIDLRTRAKSRAVKKR
jgi:transcriptional regulator with XRE-family HTH domain